MLVWAQRLRKRKQTIGEEISSPRAKAYHPKPVFRKEKKLAAETSSSRDSMSKGVKVIFGGALIGRKARGIVDVDDLNRLLDELEKNGVHDIDTAKAYAGSEEMLGKGKGLERFFIDTKCPGGFIPGNSTKEEVIQSADQSLEKLGVKQVHTFYLHSPDDNVPIASTLEGIQELYKRGVFQRFGLSNYLAEDVRKVYQHCKENGYVLPTVYQGNYNAVARKQETVLLPLLRELGIAFYAYSPIAGGFLTKTKEDIDGGAGRFNKATPPGAMYHSLYVKDSYLSALEDWEAIAKEAGCSRAELAYRWVVYNSALSPDRGDGMVLGASSIDQAVQTLQGLEAGPLDKSIADKIDAVWDKVKSDAPLDNYNDFTKHRKKQS